MKKRNISFRPTCFRYGPLDSKADGTLKLSEDELEALFLADFKGLYHEECASNLGVSRPTFAKLLKSARKKSTEMLLFGKAIELTCTPHTFTLAFATDDRIRISPNFLCARYFAFAQIVDDAVKSIAYTDNPIYLALLEKGINIENDDSAKGMAAGRIIPPLLKEANTLFARSLGEGMRRNIEGMGISIVSGDEEDIDAAVNKMSGNEERSC